MSYQFKSIRKRFLVIGITAIIILSMIYVVTSSVLTSGIIGNLIHEESSTHLKSYANMIGNWLEERINEIEIYASNPTIRTMDEHKIQPLLIDEQGKHFQKYLSLIFADDQGNYHSNLFKNAGNIAEREYFPQVMEGQSVISNPVLSQSTAKQICVVAAPIEGNRGEVVGLFGGLIDLNEFYSFIEQFQVDTKYEDTYVVSKTGSIITHSNSYFIMKENITQSSGEISEQLAEKSQNILSKEEGSFIVGEKEGKKMIAFHEIPHTDGWKIVTEIPLASLYKPLRSINLVLTAIGFFSVLLGIIGAMIVARNQARPIIQLKEAFDKATGGDLRVRVDTKNEDELGKAGKSFNTMMNKINELTYYDALTGLPNRNTFIDKVNRELSYEKTDNAVRGVLIVSLNKFKQVNEMYGHDMGDYVLAEVVNRLKRKMGPGDRVARLSGDEFIILFPGKRDKDEIIEKTEELLFEVSKVIIKEQQHIYITASSGIAFYPEDGQEAETLIKNASIAKSTAKHSEGNIYKIYDSSMKEELQEHMDISTMLQDALKHKEYFLVYQPLMGIEENAIIGAEALLRWNNPHKENISPSTFIPLLEETGLIVEVGEWVLREACRQNKRWQNMGLKSIVISVNVSPLQFEREDFVEKVRDVLKETGLEARYLELEITEGIAMQNMEGQLKKLNELQKMGVKIAIDDFGTGYSSLSYFKDFPVHTLKIDQSFVRDIVEKGNGRAITSTIISMGQNLGLRTTAEGVETKEQLEFIKDEGCNNVQGFLFSKPIVSKDFEEYLKYNNFLVLKD